tara:strand:+ start:31 stop:396 length:366 start_codon:yes stop_codon:yes gene_type:complete
LLPEINGYWYLGTVFTQHPDGYEAAYRDACVALARLLKRGVPVFCPVAHTYGAQQQGSIPNDHEFWMKVDRPLMEAAAGMIVLKMPGWKASEGLKYEVKVFDAAKKPVIFLTWDQLSGPPV